MLLTRFTTQIARLILVTSMFLLFGSVSMAQLPQINLIVEWTPTEQLDSIFLGDVRHVDMQISARANVEFWAVQLTCSVGRGELSIVPNADTVFFGSEWGIAGTDYFATPAYGSFNNANNSYNITITRVGATNSPMSFNGNTSNILLLTLRFTVNSIVRDSMVAPSCRPISFLDRQGNTVVNATQLATRNLQLYKGYTISGSVMRAGTTNHRDVRVSCVHQGSLQTYNANADARGFFAISDLREKGLYQCEFTSHLGNVYDPQFLTARLNTDLVAPRSRFLPVVLTVGDYANNGVIDTADLAVVAGNFGTRHAIFQNGDANGNAVVDDRDLAIVAGNIGLSSPMVEGHVLFGLARAHNPRLPSPNGKIWWTNTNMLSISDYYPVDARSATRDFWPQLSPDGFSLAFISLDERLNRYYLVIRDMNLGRSARSVFPRDFTRDVFAPSWSPDGSLLAFVCSDFNETSGYLYNEGNLCVINSADRTGNSLQVFSDTVEIYPPTWMVYDNDGGEAYVLVYISGNQFRYIDFGTGARGVIPFGALGSNRVSMPNIMGVYDDNGNLTRNYLMYKYTNTLGETELRTGTITYENGVFGGHVTGAFNTNSHRLVTHSENVEYYDVSTFLQVLLYRNGNDHQATYLFPSGKGSILNGTETDWFQSAGLPLNHTGTPRGIYNQPGIWDGNLNLPTMLHAQRVTFDFIINK